MSHVPPAEPDRTPEPEPTGLIGPFDLPGPPPPPPQSVQPVQPAPAPPSRMPPDPRQDFPAYTAVPQDHRQDLAGNGGAYPRQFAPWGSRVGAWLIDRLIGIAPALVLGAIGAGLVAAGSQTDDSTGTTDFGPLAAVGFVLVGLAYLTVIVIEIWNRCIRTGRTGQSIGKRLLGLYLVSEQTGQPIGAGLAFVRELCHIVDGIVCYVGYLFPLWDAKRQTLADKIVSTIVIRAPRA